MNRRNTLLRSWLLALPLLLATMTRAAEPVGLPAVPWGDPQRTHEITVDDYLTVHLLTACATSPDGQRIAFTELRWGEMDEPRQTDLWVVDAQARATRLTFTPDSESSPQWSPDGQRLYFLGKRKRGDAKPPYDGTMQVWSMGLEPGEPLPVTRVKDGIEAYQLSKDGRTLYYAKEGGEADLEWAAMRKKYGDIKFNHGPVKHTELWKLDLQTWRDEKVLAPERVILEFSVAPQGQRIALVTSPDDRLISKEGKSQVEVWDAKTKETTTLPDELVRAQGPTPYGWFESLAWSSDGRYLAYTIGYDGWQTELLVADWDGGAPRVRKLPRPGEITVNGPLAWLGDTHTLYFIGEDHARRRVCGIDVAAVGHRSETGATATLDVLTPGDLVVHAFSFAADGKTLGLIRGDATIPGDVYAQAVQPSSPPRRLTNMNAQIDTWKLPKLSLVTWKAPDGAEVEGVLELPPDYKEGDGPLPLAVELHGGPTDATLLYLQYWIYGRTLFPARGYALLSPNYRGSTGYGDKFMTDLIGRECDIEVQDILSGVNAMVERGIADPERLGVMGWSNGGFLVNCLITKTDRFKAASSGAGVLDMFLQWGLEDTPGHVINYMRGLPWERLEAYIAASPAYRLGAVTTPTIIHVGEADERVPAANARALFRALSEYRRVPSILLTYPKAGHGLVRADHRKGKLDWDVAWFDKYVLGKGE